jgi:hypothetical protein
MRCALSLPRLPQKGVASGSERQLLGLFFEAMGFMGQSILE